MRIIKLYLFLLILFTSSDIYAQVDSDLLIIRWSTVEKGRLNSGDPYLYIINKNSTIERIDLKKENLENGETIILIHKKLKNYLSDGYKLISSNFSTTSMGYCDKGEYILYKE